MSRALIVVDVQNDFCEGGALPVAGGNSVARKIATMVTDPDVARAYEMIVFTRDYHINPGSHFSDDPDYVDSWPRHCEAGTHGADYHQDIAEAIPHIPTAVYHVVKGEHEAAYSGFDGHLATHPEMTLEGLLAGVENVDVCGLATDYCVRSTALDASKLGHQVCVLTELSAGIHSDGSVGTALRDEFTKEGIKTA